MKGYLIFALLACFIGVILVLQIYPSMENTVKFTGTAISNATGYAASSGASDQAQSTLWAVFPILMVLAMFVEVLMHNK